MTSSYPLSRVRQQFPALRTGSALFDVNRTGFDGD